MAIKKAARTKPAIAAVIALPFLGIGLIYIHLTEWAIVVFLLFIAALVFYYVDRDRDIRREAKHDVKRESKYQRYQDKARRKNQ